MNLEPAPRLPKWIFLAIDAGLLLIAFLIVSFAKDPYAPLPFVTAVLCAALAAIVGLVPFLIDYAAESAEFVQRERERMNEQAARLHASVESLARAAAQIKAVEEAVHKSAREAETLPYRMQEKLAEFNEALAAKEDTDREALETELEELRAANSDQLKAVAEKIAKAAADWTALEVATRKQLSTAESSIAKLQASLADSAAKLDAAANAAAGKLDAQVATALRDLDARIADLRTAATQAPAKLAAEPTATAAAPVSAGREAVNGDSHHPSVTLESDAKSSEATPEPVTAAVETPAAEAVVPAPIEAAVDLPTTFAESPKPKKPRAPRKPKAEDTMLAMSAPEPAAEAAPAAVAAAPQPESEPAPTSESPSVPSENLIADPAPTGGSDESASEPASGPIESSTSSDGATRLLATAYIGIGNKLFIRGDGPGLSWDQGVPMQFVSIGKWGWSTHDAAGPIRCKLYKNDEVAAAVGEIVLEAGRHTEVSASF